MPAIDIVKVDPGDPPPLEGKLGEDTLYDRDPGIAMYLLTGGMASGKSSVTVHVKIGEQDVLFETSLAALSAAVHGLLAMDGQ